MLNKKANAQKIYGYDEELWYRVLKQSDNTGEQAVKCLMPLIEEHSVGKSVLDLGCGVGRISNRLALCGFDIVGIDLSNLCISDAKAHARQLGVADKTNYFVDDYNALTGLADKQFDIALCINASSWKTSREVTEFFSKLAGLMHPNALLIIQDMLKEAFLQSLYSSPNVQNWYRFEGNLLALHAWRYNHETDVVSTAKEFYEKTPEGLRFLSKITRETPVWSLKDYTCALKTAGWDVITVERRAFDLLNLEAYNSPWFTNTAVIVAKLHK